MKSGYFIRSTKFKVVKKPMNKHICLLSILFLLTLLGSHKQAEAYRGYGWFFPGLVIGGAVGWALAPRYYYPPAYYPPLPPYYYSPPGEVSQAPPMGGQGFIYPRQSQGQEKVENDRNECQGWAVDQTGYDPTKTPPAMSLDQRPEERRLSAGGGCLS